jgi:RecA-family ATPase
MIAGPPGAFKSTFALNLLCGWAQSGITALYISADSDQHTVAKRCAGILSGDPLDLIEKTIRKGNYTATLKRLTDVRWAFRAMDIAGITLHLQAFETIYGHLPDVVFVDNLMNCVSGPADFQGQITMTRDLDTLARDIKGHICILHHTSEQYHGSQPPARWDIQGKVAQFPRLILTVNCNGERMAVACVKNTNGPQQADGGMYEDFIVDTSNCRIVEAQFCE